MISMTLASAMKSRFSIATGFAAVVTATCLILTGCDSDDIQRREQEVLLKQGTAQTGMPTILRFRERKLMRMILEKRDQANINTYAYLYAEGTGKLTPLCDSVGFAIPYATQFTNPQKIVGGVAIPQADPSGLFSPESAEGSWVMCKSPKGTVEPTYVEPKVVVSLYKLG